ncbi:meiosis regulator and mRNA stability factor 1 isoform X6 [Phyllopteryx taeniolatus]|uniref:meiosis regulator and mRNA stability factor 1 isoform X6 n=1 Tax=Phyllopteryx taeniolatus TaxID=161469 RepID=UPI002AD20296|nr:meiosis regulator and mRNA stability factor 1 isoform X6 [Phyllopteryx taeniolatus]
MEGLGKERSVCSPKTSPWIGHPKTESSTLLWKLKDCFTTDDTPVAPKTDKKDNDMDSKKTALELKDVPPPPLHNASAFQPPQLFPVPPLPLPPSCLRPPQPAQHHHRQQPPLQQPQQEGPSPKVSVCAHCDYCITKGYGLSDGGDDVGSSIAGVVPHYGAPDSLPKPIYSSSNTSRSGPFSVASTVLQYKHGLSCEHKDDAYDPLPSCGYKPERRSSVTTCQPISAQPHTPCCPGLLNTYPGESLPINPVSFPSQPLLASSLSPISALPASLHGSCLASSGCYIYGMDCSPIVRRTQTSAALCDKPATTTINTLSTSAHLSSNPMHLNVERMVCVKGAHCCKDCLLKPLNGFASKSEKVWPNIPVPQTTPVSIPICNGCATSSESLVLSQGKAGQKYGSPEIGGTENIPPVGVFWDIENCSVPSGRSAGAVVQRIRSRFFQGHREAEFICVCDISKECKAVIQELNNCQVTVAHINATAKNAADDKLRQSLRRFAETHAAPATVVLVSSDVNFASELSDLRHRHGFQIILVHGNHTSQALLQHAHHHVAFQEITANLPPRMFVKTQELDNSESKPKMGFHHLDDKGRPASSSPHSNGEIGSLQQLSKPSFPGESLYKRRRDGSNPRSGTESPVEGESRSVEFQISTPSAFSKLNLHRNFSPLVLSQGSWSSRTASPCLSSRSSPILAAPQSPCPECPPGPFSDGAEIQVANLDYRMSRKELQQTLSDTFFRYGRVKAVELSPHTDYRLKATIQMLSLQQAISAVSGLHRYKIGGKRIQVSLITGGHNKSMAMLSSEISSILQDAPANCLPLFKFTEIYEKKYHRKLLMSDLYRLPDVVAVREQGGSRLVCLLSSNQSRQSPLGSSLSQDSSSTASGSPVVFEELEYHEPVCKQHYTQQNFSEADFDPDSYTIPFVVMSLSTLASEVHALLQSHKGTLPLLSFPDCYEAKFSPLQLGNETLECGVPLEHLITCVPSITIVTAHNGFKVIKWIHNKPPAPNFEPWLHRCKSPVGNPQLIQFSREVIDLLKSQPSCIMPISKFIPSYHHHFAKQCRVSDYGYSKLMELLEAVPHVLQILGMGSKRLLTLTHRAQVKRFTQDLLKLLKFQASKQVSIKDFMQAYHWCFSRDWNVADYGTCNLIDLLSEIPDTTITTTHHDTDTVISVPKRERTGDEMERTKQFGKEVVDLLRHQPHCRMPFSKFIPTYHHHFGRQCKLSYYGFTKLMELFEAIPEVLMVLECGEEKVLTLTEVERIKALAAQLVKLLRAQKTSSLPVNQLLTEYSKTFGYGLRLQDYDTSSLPALLSKLCHVVKVVAGTEGHEVQLINRKSLRLLTSQLLALLMSQEKHVDKGLRVDVLSQHYQTVHKTLLKPCEYGFLSLNELLKSLPYLVELYCEGGDRDIQAGSITSSPGDEWVRLTRLYQFARNVRALLHTYHYNQIFLSEFQGAYKKFTGCSLESRAYGYTSTDELLSAIPQVVWIKGHSHKRIIVLKNDMKERGSTSVPSSPQSGGNMETPRDSPTHSEAQSPSATMAPESELLCLTSPVDLLCGPVPSCLPSPQLHPDPVLMQQADLIHFEEKVPPVPHTSESEELNAVAVAKDDEPTPPMDAQTLLSMDSPSRRGPRSRIKLAANFSFKSGL